jgi:uncharacterized membrane protein
LGLAGGAFCQTYVQISLGQGTQTQATGINTQGAVVGFYSSTQGIHGYVRDPGGTITIFDPPGSTATTAFAINDKGTITGNYNTPSLVEHGYIRDPEGNFTTFDPPGSKLTQPNSINAGGTIVGLYQGTGNNEGLHGFVRHDDGTLIPFDPPGSVSTSANSINAKGEIAGGYCTSFPPSGPCASHGFLRRLGGEIVSFDVPESTSTVGASINEAGAITGTYTANGRNFGFVRDPGGNFTSFDPGPNTSASTINNKGAITGIASSLTGVIAQNFVRSPEGTVTLFTAPFCQPAPEATTTESINDEGVIIGSCLSTSTFLFVGWVRFP